MLNYLPPWLLKRLKTLWGNFKENEFTFEQAKKALGGGDDARVIATTLSRLGKKGWVEAKRDSKDARRTIYCLKHTEIVKELVKIEV